MSTISKELLLKYCNNCCTYDELDTVLAWFKENALTSEEQSLLNTIWEELPFEDDNPAINFDLLLDKIHHEVNLTHSILLSKKTSRSPDRSGRAKLLLHFLIRAAAILLIPVLVFGLYMASRYETLKHNQVFVNQAYNEVFSSVEAITKVTLPDGSNVWLNHSSSLKYPAVFTGSTRTVQLNGEGYFEIAHNPDIPFIVKAGEIEISAKGTAFNIMAYPDEDKIETSLINGVVELQSTSLDGSETFLLKMMPTELAVFQKDSHKITTRTIKDDRYFSWKDGKLVFNKEPMGEVVRKLSRWFNVDIQIKDPSLLELTYTATFVDETLPQVLELMTMVSPVDYSISNRGRNSNGTFSKTKVVLSFRSNLKRAY